MLIINLWGGPGAGKTTVAAEVFVYLRKHTTANVELTNEFATDLCFERAKENLKDQVYLLGNQWHRLWRLEQLRVDVAICDSPLSLGTAYQRVDNLLYQVELEALSQQLGQVYQTINIMVHRDIYAEGGFKGNKKKRNEIWLNQLDQKIHKLSRCEYSLTYTRQAGGAVAAYVLPRVVDYMVRRNES